MVMGHRGLAEVRHSRTAGHHTSFTQLRSCQAPSIPKRPHSGPEKNKRRYVPYEQHGDTKSTTEPVNDSETLLGIN